MSVPIGSGHARSSRSSRLDRLRDDGPRPRRSTSSSRSPSSSPISSSSPVDPGFTIVIKPDQSAFDNMNEFVTTMHRDSGLLNEIPNGVCVADAEFEALEYILKFVPRRAEGAAGGQHDRHRPHVPRQVHAAGRPPPALPQRRRLLDQGALAAAGSRACTSTHRRRRAATARSPTSSSPSASSATTARAAFVPEPGPTTERGAGDRGSRAVRLSLAGVLRIAGSCADSRAWWL